MNVFLGGSKTAVMLPRELTWLIDSYCKQKASFLIGDCFGADQMMQEYLHALGYPDVTVFVSGDCVRHHSGTYPIRHIPAEGCKGFDFYRQKDIAMIEERDCAVMLWDGNTRGTRCNIEDLKRVGKSYRVVQSERLLEDSTPSQIRAPQKSRKNAPLVFKSEFGDYLDRSAETAKRISIEDVFPDFYDEE